MMIGVKDVSAFDVGACNSAARRAQGGGNSLMYGACQASAGYSAAYSPGVGWINNDLVYSTKDYVDIATSSSGWTGQAWIYMHAAQYNFSTKYPFEATNIQLCSNVSGSISGNRAVFNGGNNNPCDGHSRPSWIISYDTSFTRATSGGMGEWSTCDSSRAVCGGRVIIDLNAFRISGGCSEGASSCTNTVWFGRNGNISGSGYAAERITVTIKLTRTPPAPQVTTSTGRNDPTAKAGMSGMAYIGESGSGNVSIDLGGTSDGDRVRSTSVRFYLNADGGANQISSDATISATDASSLRDKICSIYAKQGYCETNDTGNASEIKVPNDADYLGGKVCVAQAKDGKHWTTTTTKTPTIYNERKAEWEWKTTTTTEEHWNNSWDVQIACVPVAKKTNVATVGSSAYASYFKTAVERKHSGAGGKVYGSWEEFLLVTGDGTTVDNKKNIGIVGDNTNLGTSSGGGLYVKDGLGSKTKQSDTKQWSPESVGNKSISGQNVPAAGISVSNSFVQQVTKLADSRNNDDAIEIQRSDGDITITADIRNDDATKKQIIIYSKNGNINILSDVTRIDAWIIAPNGTVDTCSDAKVGTMTSNQCGNQLIINGLVYAKGITLDRTYGGTSSDLAEIINLTPASYVWAYNQASSTYASPTTVYTRELAPRT